MIQETYKLKKDRILSRLQDFKKFYDQSVSWFYENNSMILKNVKTKDSERIFEELTFCLLTANTSALMSMKAVDALRPVLINGNLENIKNALILVGYRFPNKRAEYIYEAREKFRKEYGFNFKKLIESFDDIKIARRFFAENVKGFGYKESSHFLRNIGFFGLAILDKHIIRTMYEYNVINEIPKSLTKKKYLKFEQKYVEFSNKLNIDMDELDLLLWSMKNGKIMK